MTSSLPPAIGASYWHPGDPLNELQALLITQNAPLSLIAMAADNPPPRRVAESYAFPQADVPVRPQLRLLKGGRR